MLTGAVLNQFERAGAVGDQADAVGAADAGGAADAEDPADAEGADGGVGIADRAARR